MAEKPILSWPVAAGIYVLNPGAIERAPTGRLDMPELIGLQTRVAAYPITEPWSDVGSFESLERARALAAISHTGTDVGSFESLEQARAGA